MKKRIISLILVVVMATLALSSCAYSYTKDDMSSYAKFDEEKFKKAILELVVSDADFGVNESVRLDKVEDAIFTTLAGQADKDDKKTEGVPAKYATYYYCYYCYYCYYSLNGYF